MKEEKKKLNIAQLIASNEDFNKEITINVLNDYVLNIKPKISAVQMDKIFNEFGIWIQDVEIQKLMGEVPAVKYLMCFVIKHQTDLFEQMNMSKFTNAELFKIMQVLLMSYALEDIMNNFDRESLQLLLVRYDDIVKVANKINDIKNINKKVEEEKQNRVTRRKKEKNGKS